METINTIELCNENEYPDEKVLKQVLGKSYASYCALLEMFQRKNLDYEWRYYHDGKAWLCKVQHKKRTIVWMSAWNGFMKSTVYFPEKYLDHVLQLDLDEKTKDKIRNTKNVGKSKPCIFEISNTDILSELEKVIDLKIIKK